MLLAAKTRTGGMADDVLDFLRVSFAYLNERIDRIEADMSEFRERLGHIEGQVAGIYGMYATLSSRMDRMDRRLERIERRLDLVEV
jgi:archaellum component FlaC